MSASGDGGSGKTPMACATCRKKKVKCSGSIPCSYCEKRRLECTPARPGGRRHYSATRIEQLESRLARFENNASRSLISPARAEINTAGASSSSPASTLPSSIRLNPTSKDNLGTSPGSTIQADSSLSSSHAFGSRIQDLLDPSLNRPRDTSHLRSSTRAESARFRRVDGLPDFPNQAEAHRLLEAVVFYIGQTQCHFDARVVSDQMADCVTAPYDLETLQSPPFLQVWMIVAIGRLFVGEFGENEDVPGQNLFDFIMKGFPTLGALYSLGTLGIELAALVAVYLQNSNCKEEAYIYISTALRLAVSHGLHRVAATTELRPSEKVHRNRLWWSVYMQERRVAAATGNPPSVNDDIIEIDLPSDSPGFGPSSPMHTNIKIGRVTGRILSVLYGKELHSEDVLIPHVQKIIQDLYDISKEIPSDLDAANSSSSANLPLRTNISLQLMLYQISKAIILTIRPIMLHIAQRILSGDAPSGDEPVASSLGKLTRTCTEAARRMLSAIITLRQKDLIVIFGFFDFEAAFSAAFIMILAAVFDSTCPDTEKVNPSPGLEDALEILQYLANKGNQFALRRLQDTRSLWDLMQERLQAVSSGPMRGSNNPGADEDRGVVGVSGREQTPSRGQNANTNAGPRASAEEHLSSQGGQGAEEASTFSANLWNDISYMWLTPPLNGALGTNDGEITAGAPVEDYYRYYYSSHTDGTWALPGEEMQEFTTLSRQMLSSEF